MPASNRPGYTIYTEYHAQLAKMSFDKKFDLTDGVYFYFYSIPLALYYSAVLD